jgi:hypothetical protein
MAAVARLSAAQFTSGYRPLFQPTSDAFEPTLELMGGRFSRPAQLFEHRMACRQRTTGGSDITEFEVRRNQHPVRRFHQNRDLSLESPAQCLPHSRAEHMAGAQLRRVISERTRHQKLPPCNGLRR